MSILDTKHDDTLVDFTFDHELVIDRQSVETTETPIVEKHRRASEGGRVARFFAAMRERLDRLAFGDALEEAWKLIRAGNGYIDRQAPWTLRKTDLPRMATVLRVLVDLLRAVATNLQPFMPSSMAKMLDQLGVPEDARGFADLAVPLAAGTQLPPPQGVFPRFVEE